MSYLASTYTRPKAKARAQAPCTPDPQGTRGAWNPAAICAYMHICIHVYIHMFIHTIYNVYIYMHMCIYAIHVILNIVKVLIAHLDAMRAPRASLQTNRQNI